MSDVREFPLMGDFYRAVRSLAWGHVGDLPGLAVTVKLSHIKRGIWRIDCRVGDRPAGVTEEMVQQVHDAVCEMKPQLMTPQTAAAVVEVGLINMTAAAYAVGSRAA